MPDEGIKRVCLGRAIGARGLQGEVRIKTFTHDPLAIASYGSLQDEAGTRQFELSNVKAAKDSNKSRDENKRPSGKLLEIIQYVVLTLIISAVPLYSAVFEPNDQHEPPR